MAESLQSTYPWWEGDFNFLPICVGSVPKIVPKIDWRCSTFSDCELVKIWVFDQKSYQKLSIWNEGIIWKWYMKNKKIFSNSRSNFFQAVGSCLEPMTGFNPYARQKRGFLESIFSEEFWTSNSDKRSLFLFLHTKLRTLLIAIKLKGNA